MKLRKAKDAKDAIPEVRAPAAPAPESASQAIRANAKRAGLLARLDARGARKERPVKEPRKLPNLALPLAILALLDAVWASVQIAQGQLLGLVTLPWSAAFLALSGVFPMKPGAVRLEAAKLRLAGLSFVALCLLVALTLVEGVAVLAGLGLIFSFSQLAVVFVRVFPVALGGILALAALLRITAGRWGLALPYGRLRRSGAALLSVPAFAVALYMLVAVLRPQAATLTVDRAPFVAALAGLLGIAAVWAGTLPGLGTAGSWLTERGAFSPRAARRLTHLVAVPALLLAGLALALPAGFRLGALAAAVALAMVAAYPAGVGRWMPALGKQDPVRMVKLRRNALRALLGVGILGLLLAGIGVLLSLRPGRLAALPPALVAAASLVQAMVCIVTVRLAVPGEVSKVNKATSWNLSLAALLALLFALLLGSGVAQGPGVGEATGTMLLALASMSAGGHVILRAVLLPARKRMPKAKKARRVKGKEALDTKQRIQRSMHVAYAVGLGGTAVMVSLIVATSLRVVDVQKSTGLPPAALILLGMLAAAPLLGFAMWRWFQAKQVEVQVQQRAAEVYKKRLSQEDAVRLAIIGGSITVAVLFATLGLLTQFGVLKSLAGIKLVPKFSTDFFVFALLVGLGPAGFHRARQLKRMAAIDQKFPELLRDLAESKRAGMTLTQAVITSAKGNYGALTPDIRKMAAQIEWGISFSEALMRFGKRVKTPLIERSVALIVQASDAGGNVVDVLTAAAEDARELQLLQRERKASMSIYVMIIYISFFVFLAVIAVLDAQFLPEVAKAVGGASGVAIGPIKFGKIDVDAFKQVFFHAAIIQAMGGGLVAGVMEEGRPEAGLRHVFVMVIVGYLGFRFIIGG
ncbi:MAG: type II secretion system F family protein [Halobacteriales archaeon]|nr:type II secretion system F family protein [Halobacteriales archaeon]